MRLTVFATIFFLLQACSVIQIEKRRFNKGYSVEFNTVKRNKTVIPTSADLGDSKDDIAYSKVEVKSMETTNIQLDKTSASIKESFLEPNLSDNEQEKITELSDSNFPNTKSEGFNNNLLSERSKDCKSANEKLSDDRKIKNKFLRVIAYIFGSIGLTILAGAGIVLSSILIGNSAGIIGIVFGCLGIFLSITIALYLFIIMIQGGTKNGQFLKALWISALIALPICIIAARIL